MEVAFDVCSHLATHMPSQHVKAALQEQQAPFLFLFMQAVILTNLLSLLRTMISVHQHREHGMLAGQDVVLAATGIGPTAAALCLMELLDCADRIQVCGRQLLPLLLRRTRR